MLPPDIVVTTLLEYSSLEQNTKDKILAMIPAIQQYQQQQAEEQRMAKLQKSVEDSMLKKDMKEQAELQKAVTAAQPNAAPTLGGTPSTM